MTNKELEKLVKQLQKEINELKSPTSVVQESKVESKLDLEIENEVPVPLDWRREIDLILNPNFGVALGHTQQGFDFNILVPEKYSTISADQKKNDKFDRRRKIIPVNEGLNGVKEYVGLVFKSFNPTYQAMIVADRK